MGSYIGRQRALVVVTHGDVLFGHGLAAGPANFAAGKDAGGADLHAFLTLARFEFKVPVEGKELKIILYGGDPDVLTAGVLPETQNSYDLFYSNGLSLNQETYRDAARLLKQGGLFFLRIVPTFYADRKYDPLLEMENTGALEGLGGLVSRLSENVFAYWKKTGAAGRPLWSGR